MEGIDIDFGDWGDGLQDLIEVDHFSNWSLGSGDRVRVGWTNL